MTTSKFLQAAIYLADLGYSVFPCVTGGKRPLTAHGLKDATTDSEQIAQWWSQWPNANIGLVTSGLLVVDVDPLAEGGANPWLANDADRLLDLAAAPMSITPRGGRHYIFRQPVGMDFRNTGGTIAPHVDTRANGGYIVVAPSVLDGGKCYRWVSGSLELRPDELPEPPAWLIAALSDKPASKVATSAGSANMIPAGQRNAALTSLAGYLRRAGMSEPEIFAAISAANAGRCSPPLAEDEVRTIAGSVVRYPPHAETVAKVEHHAEQERESDYDDYRLDIDDPGPLPESLLSVPGFIGQVIEHNLAGAFKPQPALALAGALALLATLTGRKITDRYDTRTNLYLLGVCGTSSGKERARVVNKEILQYAGLEVMIGPESIGSSAGLVSVVEQQPALLLQLDEIGRHMKTLHDAHQPHLYNVISVLLKLFSTANQTYIGDAYADTKRIKTIKQPHAVVYGTTTPDVLLESLSSDSLTDGFLSRVLIFEGCEPALVDREKPEPPKSLIEQARWWGDFKPSAGNLATINPQPLVVEMTDEAKRLIAAFSHVADERRTQLGEPLGSLWPRAIEKARKLALLWACSVNAQEPRIDAAAVQWATDVVSHLTRRLAFLASRWLSENRQESNTKRVARIVEAAKSQGVTKSALTRATQWLSRRERDEVLTTLIESGQIVLRQMPTATKTRNVYLHSRYRESFISSIVPPSLGAVCT